MSYESYSYTFSDILLDVFIFLLLQKRKFLMLDWNSPLVTPILSFNPLNLFFYFFVPERVFLLWCRTHNVHTKHTHTLTTHTYHTHTGPDTFHLHHKLLLKLSLFPLVLKGPLLLLKVSLHLYPFMVRINLFIIRSKHPCIPDHSRSDWLIRCTTLDFRCTKKSFISFTISNPETECEIVSSHDIYK